MQDSIYLTYDVTPESLLEAHEANIRFRDRNRKRTSPLILILFSFCFGSGLLCLTVSDLIHIASDLGLPITDWPLKNLIAVDGENSEVDSRLRQPWLPRGSRLEAPSGGATHGPQAMWMHKAGLLIKHVGVLLFLSLTWLVIYVQQRPRNYFVRSAVRNSFRKLYPEGQATYRWWIDEGSLYSEEPQQRTSTTWDAFPEIAETPKGFLIYNRVGQPTIWLPVCAFGSAESLRRFADLARSKVTNYVALGECRFSAKPKPVGLDEL